MKHTDNSDLGGRLVGARRILNGNGIFAGICQRAGIDLEHALSHRVRDIRLLLHHLVVFLPDSFDRLGEYIDLGRQFERLSCFHNPFFHLCQENRCSGCEQIEIIKEIT